ncbi:MAG TPA: plastocyanin/azurin family copper-binding protein [Gaiellaceae bacterium]|nr:plastocyanin/azurin family copper-binding protein [Gaiellaceae bacterium]
MRLTTLLAVAAVALIATAAASPVVPPKKLYGTVGPGFTIMLKSTPTSTKRVTALKAGRYTFVVADKSSIHNFEIEGVGMEKEITDVSAVGTKTVTLTLKRGVYKYYCKPHESTMHGSFRVT